MSNTDWYRYYAPHGIAGLTPERLSADRAAAEHDLDALLARTGLQPTDRVLEIGCGWGRHALAFAARGFQRVTSIDIAPEPLALAQALTAETGLRCDFRHGDFLEVADGPYAAVLSLYDRSICGFPTEEQDALSLRHVAELLQPGGWLVFGINDWPLHLPGPSRDWTERAGGVELIEVVPDRAAMTCAHRVTLLAPHGARERYTLRRRHYVLPELRRLLADAGLRVEVALHRLTDSEPYGEQELGLFVFARRAARAGSGSEPR